MLPAGSVGKARSRCRTRRPCRSLSSTSCLRRGSWIRGDRRGGIGMGLNRRLTALVALAVVGPMTGAAHASDAKPMSVDYHQWSSASEFAAGAVDGTSVQIVKHGALVLGTGLTSGSDPGDGRYSGHDYEMGSWTSQWYRPGFEFGELVSSWNAR